MSMISQLTLWATTPTERLLLLGHLSLHLVPSDPNLPAVLYHPGEVLAGTQVGISCGCHWSQRDSRMVQKKYPTY